MTGYWILIIIAIVIVIVIVIDREFHFMSLGTGNETYRARDLYAASSAERDKSTRQSCTARQPVTPRLDSIEPTPEYRPRSPEQ